MHFQIPWLFMTFHDFSWPYEPCRNISVPGLTTAGISPQDCLSLYSTCVPSSLNDLLVNKKLKDLSLLVHSHTLSSTLGDLTHLLTYMHAHTSISYRRITTQCTWFNNHWCSTTKLSWSPQYTSSFVTSSLHDRLINKKLIDLNTWSHAICTH